MQPWIIRLRTHLWPKTVFLRTNIKSDQIQNRPISIWLNQSYLMIFIRDKSYVNLPIYGQEKYFRIQTSKPTKIKTDQFSSHWKNYFWWFSSPTKKKLTFIAKLYIFSSKISQPTKLKIDQISFDQKKDFSWQWENGIGAPIYKYYKTVVMAKLKKYQFFTHQFSDQFFICQSCPKIPQDL